MDIDLTAPKYEIAPESDTSESYDRECKWLRLYMQMYMFEFPKKLAKYAAINFEDMSLDELKKLRQEMDKTLAEEQLKARIQILMGIINTHIENNISLYI